MAVSPLDFPVDEDTDPKALATRIVSLAVRTNSLDGASGKDQNSREAAPKLSEQLNEEIRQKYVKGLPFQPSLRSMLSLEHR